MVFDLVLNISDIRQIYKLIHKEKKQRIRKMGAITNCCASKKNANKKGIDFDKELTGELE